MRGRTGQWLPAGRLLAQWRATFDAAGVSEPRQSAGYLLSAAVGCASTHVNPSALVSPQQQTVFRRMCARRLARFVAHLRDYGMCVCGLEYRGKTYLVHSARAQRWLETSIPMVLLTLTGVNCMSAWTGNRFNTLWDRGISATPIYGSDHQFSSRALRPRSVSLLDGHVLPCHIMSGGRGGGSCDVWFPVLLRPGPIR